MLINLCCAQGIRSAYYHTKLLGCWSAGHNQCNLQSGHICAHIVDSYTVYGLKVLELGSLLKLSLLLELDYIKVGPISVTTCMTPILPSCGHCKAKSGRMHRNYDTGGCYKASPRMFSCTCSTLMKIITILILYRQRYVPDTQVVKLLRQRS